ncbi:predicted protein [Lichtheimia corymbifera JMRC:FSU:9682]|uniref:Uncharacterized protein n=1 Tax=Lichtheimia corymbifera JMRC:FSU:9682 TaxID=1263082 RepID=A0A068SGK4_9FUNG|nr:predicted protein [Lichtheimia corymbifera JMRC:FSU:9682]
MSFQSVSDSEVDDLYPQEMIDTDVEEAQDREDGLILTGRAALAPQGSTLSMMTDTTEATEATEDQPRPKRSKSTNSWVFTNGWAIIDDSGSYNICQYPTASGSCGRRYKRVGATTSSIIYHLQTQHSVDRNSVFEAVNTGPLDMMLRIPLAAPFSADMFQERLLRLVIAHALLLYPDIYSHVCHPAFLSYEWEFPYHPSESYLVITNLIHFGCLLPYTYTLHHLILHLPFSIVESNEFQELLRLASRAPIPNAITLPSRRTLCRGLEAMFDVYKDRVMQQLESLPDLSYTLDAWTSEQKVPILGVTAQWITDSWEQQSCIIGFEPLSGPHSGANLAMAFCQRPSGYAFGEEALFYHH